MRQNSILAVLAAVALVSGVLAFTLDVPADAGPPTPTPYAIYPVGDINCSGHTSSIDALLVLQFDVGLAEVSDLPCFGNGDVDLDERVGPRDAALILQCVSG